MKLLVVLSLALTLSLALCADLTQYKSRCFACTYNKYKYCDSTSQCFAAQSALPSCSKWYDLKSCESEANAEATDCITVQRIKKDGETKTTEVAVASENYCNTIFYNYLPGASGITIWRTTNASHLKFFYSYKVPSEKTNQPLKEWKTGNLVLNKSYSYLSIIVMNVGVGPATYSYTAIGSINALRLLASGSLLVLLGLL